MFVIGQPYTVHIKQLTLDKTRHVIAFHLGFNRHLYTRVFFSLKANRGGGGWIIENISELSQRRTLNDDEF